MSGFLKHPLGGIVRRMDAASKLIDVTTVAAALCGNACFKGAGARKGTNAYRVVAADVLGCMTDAGELKMHGSWIDPGRPEEGGPWFTLVA